MTIKNKQPFYKNLYTPKSFLLMLAGVTMATFALRGFMIPNHFLDGGVTGISLLLQEIIHVPFSILVFSINLMFFVLAYKHVSTQFIIRSLIAVSILAIGVQFIHIPMVTSDKLLIAIFGGCCIGLGIGLIIRSGAALDGFELIALITNKKSGFSISEIVLFLNSIIFLVSALKFGIEASMYSIITYFAALRIADYVVDGIEEYTSLTIISKESEKIKAVLVNNFSKGITVYKGERGYLPGAFEVKTDCDVIVTIVTRLEIVDITNQIMMIDPAAFVYTYKIKETKGGIMKPRQGGH